MRKIISKIAIGISWGFTVLTMILFVGVIINHKFLSTISQQEFINYVICSAVVGLGFSVPTVVYDSERLSQPIKIFIHLGIAFAIYIPISLIAGWIPINQGFITMAISFVLMIIISFIVYLGFYFYYKKEANKMNQKIQSIECDK